MAKSRSAGSLPAEHQNFTIRPRARARARALGGGGRPGRRTGIEPDRADLYSEYVPTLAIVEARLNHLSEQQLDKLLDVDFGADLVTARRSVDSQPDFASGGRFGAARARLVSLRRSIDAGTAPVSEIQRFFNGLAATIDDQWQQTFQSLSRSSESSTALGTEDRVSALGVTWNAFTSGLAEENLPEGDSLESLLVSGGTPADVQSLIVSHEQFEASAAGLPDGLGPNAASAWDAMFRNPLTSKFSGYVRLAITVGLAHDAPPYRSDAAAIGEIAKSEVEWYKSLTNLALASSTDLRTATTAQADSASRDLDLIVLFVVLLVLAALAGVLALGRAIRRPLSRLVAVAESVRSGEVDVPELDESGPKEPSLAAGAVNEMSATLRTVQTQAIALAGGELDDPSLKRLRPGRTGGALQSALSELQVSFRDLYAQRQVLNERATRDFLTGPLNREATFGALERDFARVQRSEGQLALAILFIDVDDLKRINDSSGHDGGDRALRGLAVEHASKMDVSGEAGAVRLGCSIGVASAGSTSLTGCRLLRQIGSWTRLRRGGVEGFPRDERRCATGDCFCL